MKSDASDYGAKALCERHLGCALPEPATAQDGQTGADDAPTRAAAEAAAARALVPALADALEKDGSAELFSTIEMPLLPVLAQMEREGLSVDPSILAAQSAELGAEISAMVDKIHAAAGEDFNLDSPMQLSHVLFDVLGLPTKGLKKTSRGFYSTNAKVLGDLARDHSIVAEVLEYRERAKIRSTYLDALPALVRGDGRIHTTLNQTVAATGRLSSSDPNLQNIPTRSELGHRVRQCLHRCLRAACSWPATTPRSSCGCSPTSPETSTWWRPSTAARTSTPPPPRASLACRWTQVTPQLRSRAKAVNFGIVYGQQAYGLATSLKIPRAEAQEMIDRYFDAYPGVRAYLDESVRLAHERGWATTMYGRKRHIKEFRQQRTSSSLPSASARP